MMGGMGLKKKPKPDLGKRLFKMKTFASFKRQVPLQTLQWTAACPWMHWSCASWPGLSLKAYFNAHRATLLRSASPQFSIACTPDVEQPQARK